MRICCKIRSPLSIAKYQGGKLETGRFGTGIGIDSRVAGDGEDVNPCWTAPRSDRMHGMFSLMVLTILEAGFPDFVPHVITDDVPGAYCVRASDVDGDGKVDVIAQGRDVVWFKNFPNFRVRYPSDSISSPGPRPPCEIPKWATVPEFGGIPVPNEYWRSSYPTTGVARVAGIDRPQGVRGVVPRGSGRAVRCWGRLAGADYSSGLRAHGHLGMRRGSSSLLVS